MSAKQLRRKASATTENSAMMSASPSEFQESPISSLLTTLPKVSPVQVPRRSQKKNCKGQKRLPQSLTVMIGWFAYHETRAK